MKEAVTSELIRQHFDRSKAAIVESKSSDYIGSGVLSHYDDEGLLHPVAFPSRKMVPVECPYPLHILPPAQFLTSRSDPQSTSPQSHPRILAPQTPPA